MKNTQTLGRCTMDSFEFTRKKQTFTVLINGEELLLEIEDDEYYSSVSMPLTDAKRLRDWLNAQHL